MEKRKKNKKNTFDVHKHKTIFTKGWHDHHLDYHELGSIQQNQLHKTKYKVDLS